ncbi:MAG: hypothetical protein ACI4TW_01905 [Prevotella sp.]
MEEFTDIREYTPPCIDGMKATAEDIGTIYSLDSRRVTAPQKGKNIIRYNNGNTVKQIKR